MSDFITEKTEQDIATIYEQLKDKYDLLLTNTSILDEGFTINCPIIVGKAHEQIIELYVCDGMFVMCVMDDKKTKGTHWHPHEINNAINDIKAFMGGKSNYRMELFERQEKSRKSGYMKKIGKVFETILYIFIGILFIVPIIIIVLIDCINDKMFMSKQFRKLKNAGYKISKVKDQGKKVYLFAFKLIVIKFLPNEIHDISFDGGETYTPIIESNIGAPQEIEHLRNLKYQYQTSDYRDRDMYDSTEEFIKFILKNINLDK